MNYLGDFAEDATVYIPFNTFTSNDPSASATITNLADADIKVHKDGSVTQIVTDGATVAIDFDTITGNHLITIDTSVHADYAIGSDYMVRIEGTTVDAGTINAWIGSFSIENRFKDVNVVSVGGTTQTALDINDILDDTAAMQPLVAKIPLSDGSISWNSTALAAINAEADTALTDYDPPTKAEMDTGHGLLATPTNITAATGIVLSGVTHTSAVIPTVTAVTNEVTADVTKISGDATAADNLEASLETMLVGTATGGTTTTVTSALTGYGDDTFIGRILLMRTGTLQFEAGAVTDYDSTAGTFTFAAATWTTSPTTETFVIV